jgi:hypothetical protein
MTLSKTYSFAGWLNNQDSLLEGAKNFSLLHCVRTVTKAHAAFYPVELRDLLALLGTKFYLGVLLQLFLTTYLSYAIGLEGMKHGRCLQKQFPNIDSQQIFISLF